MEFLVLLSEFLITQVSISFTSFLSITIDINVSNFFLYKKKKKKNEYKSKNILIQNLVNVLLS